MSESLGFIPTKRLTGTERFHHAGRELSTVEQYWQWSPSDLMNNTDRAIVAEYIVALDIDITDGVQAGWEAFDLWTPEGIAVEVKSAAYVQTWKQERLSQILFGIAPTHAWNPRTDEFAPEKKRQAQVYVFCLLAHQDQDTIDPRNLDQWEFYVLATAKLDAAMGPAKSIGIAKLRELGPPKVRFGEIHEAIRQQAGYDRR